MRQAEPSLPVSAVAESCARLLGELEKRLKTEHESSEEEKFCLLYHFPSKLTEVWLEIIMQP